MARVDGQGRQDRVHVLVEVGREIRTLHVVQLDVAHHRDAAVRQFGQERIEHDAVLAFDERRDAFANRDELLARTDPVDRRRLHAGRDLVLETDDTDLEELVDHVGKDRHELEPLENRQLLVFGQIEQSGAEFESGEFSTREPLGPKRDKIDRHGVTTLSLSIEVLRTIVRLLLIRGEAREH